jgi:hypothetical protein
MVPHPPHRGGTPFRSVAHGEARRPRGSPAESKIAFVLVNPGGAGGYVLSVSASPDRSGILPRSPQGAQRS